jgi:hypothetical protein
MTWRHVGLLGLLLWAGCGGGGGGGDPDPGPIVFKVTAVSPSGPDSENVPLSQDVLVMFTKPVDAASLTPDSFKVVAESGDPIPGARSVPSNAPTQIRFTPLQGYLPFALHTIAVTTAVLDENGDPLDRNYSFIFRTQEDGPVLPVQAQVENKGDLLRTGRFLHRMTLLPIQRFLVTGGYAVDGQPAIGSAENLIVATEESHLIASSLIGPRAAHVQVTLKDGRVLVAGGERASFPFVPLATAEIFDPEPTVFAFSPAAPMHFPRSFAHASVLDDGRVLVTGGQGLATDGVSVIFRADAELYDPVADAWTLVGSRMEAGRAGHFSATTQGGDVVVIGGTPGLPSATLWRKSGETFSMQLGTPFFDHFFGAGTVLPDGRPFVASGVSSLGVTIWDSRFGFVGAINQFAAERAFATATAFADGRVLIVGGFDVGASPPVIHDTFDVFFPIGATGRIFRSVDATLDLPTSHHDAALGPDGKIWITGGLGPTGNGLKQVVAIRPDE